VARIDSFLRLVLDQQASDLHFHAGNVPVVRHDGDLVPLPFRTLSDEETRRFVGEIMTDEQKERFERDREVDFAYDVQGGARFRVNVFTQSRGVGAVFRIIPARLPTIDELRLPYALKKLAQQANGLVLITGPTGSGKTTTLAAIVNEINRTSRRHVITIEDPIEFVHQPLQSVITQRQIGKHTESFGAALRSALREAPDVIVVGEMRDYETVQLGLSAAETGVLVFGTLHTNSAAKAVDRVIDVCPEEVHDQVRGILSVLLKGVMAQHLCKRATGEGRVTEMLLQTYATANMIRENKTFQLDSFLQSSDHGGSGHSGGGHSGGGHSGGGHSGGGMRSLDASILDYVKSGVISPEDALKIANYPDILRRAIAELPEDA
jgi:twitching motility protein PilT